MADDGLHFIVLTPAKTLLDVDDASKVRVKLASEDWLSIYPRHLPLLAETMAGPVQYVTAGRTSTLALAEGILQVRGYHVTLFTRGVVEASQDDLAQMETDMRFDRLARELMLALQAYPQGVLGEDGERV